MLFNGCSLCILYWCCAFNSSFHHKWFVHKNKTKIKLHLIGWPNPEKRANYKLKLTKNVNCAITSQTKFNRKCFFFDKTSDVSLKSLAKNWILWMENIFHIFISIQTIYLNRKYITVIRPRKKFYSLHLTS